MSAFSSTSSAAPRARTSSTRANSHTSRSGCLGWSAPAAAPQASPALGPSALPDGAGLESAQERLTGSAIVGVEPDADVVVQRFKKRHGTSFISLGEALPEAGERVSVHGRQAVQQIHAARAGARG